MDIPRTLEDVRRPARLALIVSDMQVGILRQLEDRGAGVLAKVLAVLQAARDAGVRVIFMRHLSMPKELMGAFQMRQAMAWQRVDSVDQVTPWFLPQSPAFQLAPELTVRPSEAVLDKITFSAFEGTPLAIVLRDCGVTGFAIVGAATEIGIEPTVRHGSDLGLIPVVVADACAAGHPEMGAHAVALLRFLGDAMFTDTRELCDVLSTYSAKTSCASLATGDHIVRASPDAASI